MPNAVLLGREPFEAIVNGGINGIADVHGVTMAASSTGLNAGSSASFTHHVFADVAGTSEGIERSCSMKDGASQFSFSVRNPTMAEFVFCGVTEWIVKGRFVRVMNGVGTRSIAGVKQRRAGLAGSSPSFAASTALSSLPNVKVGFRRNQGQPALRDSVAVSPLHTLSSTPVVFLVDSSVSANANDLTRATVRMDLDVRFEVSSVEARLLDGSLVPDLLRLAL